MAELFDAWRGLLANDDEFRSSPPGEAETTAGRAEADAWCLDLCRTADPERIPPAARPWVLARLQYAALVARAATAQGPPPRGSTAFALATTLLIDAWHQTGARLWARR